MAKPKRKLSEPERTNEMARLEDVVMGLHTLFKSLESQLHGAGEHHSSVQEFCRVATALAAAEGELRQYRKGLRRELAAYSTEQVVAYLKTLNESTRADIVNELTGADDEEPLL